MTSDTKTVELAIPAEKVADAADDNQDDDQQKEEFPKMELHMYYYPEYKYEIIQKLWGSITLYTLPYYLIHLFFAVYGVDQYTDVSRTISCNANSPGPEKSAAVFQTAIGLVVVYHCIEFMRHLAMASAALVGVNLIGIYYFLSLNVLYGLVAMIMALAARFGADGAACAEEGKQNHRAQYLMLQLIPLIMQLFSAFHVLLLFRCKGADWCHETINMEDEEEEEGPENDD